MSEVCEQIQELIKKARYKVHYKSDYPEKCIVHFTHPSVKEEDIGLFSGVYYDKTTGALETTVRRKVKTFGELYLDYCCEDEIQKCRPHVWMDEKVLSVEAKFEKDVLDRFVRLLRDMYD